MMNYIWAGLIIFSLLFALTHDTLDLLGNKYRNAQSMPVRLMFSDDAQGESTPVKVVIESDTYNAFYGVEETVAASYPATLINTGATRELLFTGEVGFPQTLATIRRQTMADGHFRAAVTDLEMFDETTAWAAVQFPTVRFAYMKDIGAAAIDMARFAVDLAIRLIGVLAIWLGLARIGEKAGLIDMMVRLVQPVLRPLFPGIPKDHPAMAMVALNLSANFLGLGNAATPFGIKAMEELQKLNRVKNTATNAMVTFLAMNTAGVQLIPPAMLIAVMGMKSVEYIFPIWIVTGLSLVIAIAAAKLLSMLPVFRRSDPDQSQTPPDEMAEPVEAARA